MYKIAKNFYRPKFTTKKYVLAFGICFLLLLITSPVTANENDIVGFSIRTIKSDRQFDKNVSYFDLMLSPKEEHMLEVDIFNTSDKSISTSVSARTAGTNSGGVVEYDKAGVTDESLKIAFEDIATVESPIVSIPAKSSKRVKINVKMPEQSFDGIMLGSIVVKKMEDTNTENLPDTVGTSIKNEYCYVSAVKIRLNDIEVEPDLRLRNIAPKLSNHHTSIAVNLQNHQAALIKGIKIDANVYYNNSSEATYSKSSNNFDIAPNSNFDYIIPCSGKLNPGTYKLLLTATLGDRIWEFDESFTITGDVISNINESAVNVASINYYQIATICLAIILIIILLIIALRIIIAGKKKRKEENF